MDFRQKTLLGSKKIIIIIIKRERGQEIEMRKTERERGKRRKNERNLDGDIMNSIQSN